MNMFRTLRADEIDCRIAQVKENGLSLLLYKDARCDQNILDETVGPMNWQRHHTRDNRNCIVSIWDADKGEWIEKEDTGTESNTEKEKGLASDSFKRACFNWGIGRELYTAPFIWVSAKDCNIKEYRGKLGCYDRFTVKGIGYTDGVITGLEIKNQATGKLCYKWGEICEEAPEKPEQPDDEPDSEEQEDKKASAVEKADKLPEGSQTVANYMMNNITDIQEKLGMKTYKEAREKVFKWGDELMKSGAIEKFVWASITVEQAKNLFETIRTVYDLGESA